MNDDGLLIEAMGLLIKRFKEEREDKEELLENLAEYRESLAESRTVHLAAVREKDTYGKELGVLKRDRTRMIGEAEEAEERKRWVAAKLQQQRTLLRERLTGKRENEAEATLLDELTNIQDVLQGSSEIHKEGGSL